jgi:hypothetical protein
MLVLSDATARRTHGPMGLEACGLMAVSLREQHGQWLRPTYVVNGQ